MMVVSFGNLSYGTYWTHFLTLLTSFLSVYTLGKWSLPGIFGKTVGICACNLGTYSDYVVFLWCFQVQKFFKDKKKVLQRYTDKKECWEGGKSIDMFAVKGHLTRNRENWQLFM